MKIFWENKSVLVTGADGFIGSWLTKALLQKRANVITIVRNKKLKSCLEIQGIKDKVEIVYCDIKNMDVLKEKIKELNIDSCFHLAADSIVVDANKNPVPTFESNIIGTLNVLETCRLSGKVKRIIVASGDKVYGTQKQLPYTEDMPLLGVFPSDASKVCTEILANSYFKSFGLNICIVRSSNVYGGCDLNLSRIVPGTIISILKHEPPIIRSDGTLERDYIYVEDLVHAYITLAENMHRKEILGEAFNFGTQNPIRVIDLFNKITKLCGTSGKPKILGVAFNEINRQFLSIKKAKRLLNWEPKFSLEDGLKLTIKWYKENLELFI